jgi:predicted small secreted protein
MAFSDPVETPRITAMNKPHKNIVILIIASALFAAINTSCRTVQGFGSDVKHTGDHIKEAASR